MAKYNDPKTGKTVEARNSKEAKELFTEKVVTPPKAPAKKKAPKKEAE